MHRRRQFLRSKLRSRSSKKSRKRREMISSRGILQWVSSRSRRRLKQLDRRQSLMQNQRRVNQYSNSNQRNRHLLSPYQLLSQMQLQLQHLSLTTKRQSRSLSPKPRSKIAARSMEEFFQISLVLSRAPLSMRMKKGLLQHQMKELCLKIAFSPRL